MLDESKRIVGIYDEVKLRAREAAEGTRCSIVLGIPYYATCNLAGAHRQGIFQGLSQRQRQKRLGSARLAPAAAQEGRGRRDHQHVHRWHVRSRCGNVDLVPLSRERQVLLCSQEFDLAGQKSVKAACAIGHCPLCQVEWTAERFTGNATCYVSLSPISREMPIESAKLSPSTCPGRSTPGFIE